MFSNYGIKHQTVVEHQNRQSLQVIDHPPVTEGVVYMRTIYVGRKPVHSYVAAVLRAMQDGDREVEIIDRGNSLINRKIKEAKFIKQKKPTLNDKSELKHLQQFLVE